MQVSSAALKRLGVSFVRELAGISEYTLTSNGLKILLLEQHLAPVVTSTIMYRVGSRNEGVGFTGSTHFLEHMMFKSTTEHDSANGTGFVDMLKPTGADYNAFTGQDSTSYVICLPKEKLALALALEADRMRNLRLRVDERDSEMTVVRNEFEVNESDIDDVMFKQTMAMAFSEHPYHHPVIGWRDDVEQVPLSRMQQFYDTFYWPNNATLVIAGDFDPSQALGLVVEYFGKIPKAPNPIPHVYTSEPVQTGARSFEIKREGPEYAKLYIAFKTPSASHPDHHALAVIADLLGGDGSESSRLCAALIEPRIALDCVTYATPSRDSDLFLIRVTANGYGKIKAAEKAIHAELSRLMRKPVGQRELARVKQMNRHRVAEVKGDSMKIAEGLCDAEAVTDWTWKVEYNDKYDAVTSADIKRVARKYLHPDNSTTGRAAPLAKTRKRKPKVDTASGASEERVEPKLEIAVPPTGVTVEVPGEPLIGSRIAKRASRIELPNGLRAIVLPVPGSGVVSVSGCIQAGDYFTKSSNGAIPELTAELLRAGSCSIGKRQLADRLEALGCELDFAVDEFAVKFGSTFIPDSLDEYLGLVGSVLQEPRFAPGEFNRCKSDMQSDLSSNEGDASVTAAIKWSQALYPQNHAFACPTLKKQAAHLSRATLKEVRSFHAQHYVPGATVLGIVGDVDVEAVKTRLEEVFGAWTGEQPAPIVIPKVELPAERRRIDIPLAGKTSAEIMIGFPVSLKKSDRDFPAAEIATAILGLDTLSSRLGVTVRTKHGLTYGITSSFDDVRFGEGPWLIQLSVNPANVERALALVDAVVANFVQHGITDRELAEEASRLYGQHVVNLRTTAGLAHTLCLREFRGASLRGLDEEWKRLHSVTKEQVNAAIRKYLRFDKAVTVVVGK